MTSPPHLPTSASSTEGGVRPIPLLPTPKPISEQEWADDVPPLVSILCITFNHECFIEECLKGFLAQETTFPVEIVVHDDASTDLTAEIIRRYAERHPKLFRTKLQSENQYQKGNRIISLALELTRGKYCALCEGDDFWTDASKLQKQFDFMESHPDFSMCATEYRVIDTTGRIVANHGTSPLQQRDLTHFDILHSHVPRTLTSFLRRNSLQLPFPEEFALCRNADWLLFSLVTRHGPAAYLSDVTGSYRMHANGYWSPQSRVYQERNLLQTTVGLWNYFREPEQRKTIHYRMVVHGSLLLRESFKESWKSYISSNYWLFRTLRRHHLLKKWARINLTFANNYLRSRRQSETPRVSRPEPLPPSGASSSSP